MTPKAMPICRHFSQASRSRGAFKLYSQPSTAASAVPSPCQVLPEHAIVALCARARRISFGRPVPALARLRVGHRAAFLGRAADIKAAQAETGDRFR